MDENAFIPYGRQCIEDDDVRAVTQVLRSGWLTQGPKAAEFEEAFARCTGARFAVSVNSGTAALHLACLAAGLGAGDRAATTPITFAASANCVLYAGAEPVFVDIDPVTRNLSPAALERSLLEEGPLRAVIPVHYGGLPCNMPAIWRIARKLGIVVIEDACHALGASYKDPETRESVRVGACRHSHMAVFSFHPVKHIATGEGGMVTTNDPDLHERLALFRNHGITRDSARFFNPSKRTKHGDPVPGYYEMQELGFNFRLSDIACALGLSQLKKIGRFVEARRKAAQTYNDLFKATPNLETPPDGQGGVNSYHLYPVRIPFERLGLNREDVMKKLEALGVGTQVHYIPVPAHPYYRRLGFDPAMQPRALRYYKECLSLPMFATLTESDIARTAGALLSLLPGSGES